MHLHFKQQQFVIKFQEGDVIELCQVSDIRAGGIPKVSCSGNTKKYK